MQCMVRAQILHTTYELGAVAGLCWEIDCDGQQKDLISTSSYMGFDIGQGLGGISGHPACSKW